MYEGIAGVIELAHIIVDVVDGSEAVQASMIRDDSNIGVWSWLIDGGGNLAVELVWSTEGS